MGVGGADAVAMSHHDVPKQYQPSLITDGATVFFSVYFNQKQLEKCTHDYDP